MRAMPEQHRPIIGITTKEVQRPTDSARLFAQVHNYSEVISNAGGIALMIPQMEDPDSPASQAALEGACNVFDGFVIAGGNDVNPDLYGESPHPTTERWSNSHDQTELRIMNFAEEKNIPMLAICRGMQIWNVAKGGSLHQHVPDLGLGMDHVNKNDELEIRQHNISIEKASAIGGILLPDTTRSTLGVNSFHHQAINELGDGLKIVARADDGIIEAIETTKENWFAIGVQWHPEAMEEAFSRLFKTFVSAASGVPRNLRVAA